MKKKMNGCLLVGAFFFAVFSGPSYGAPAPAAVPYTSPPEATTVTPAEEEPTDTGFDPDQSPYAHPAAKKDPTAVPGGYVKMSGRYRMASGADGEDFILNDSNADLQERNFRYLFGERHDNTYDPAIYSQYLLNVDFAPRDRFNFYTQVVADPWSYVGSTGEREQRSDIGSELLRFDLKYFGAFNSTINEIYRTNVADSIAFPVIKVQDGKTVPTVVHGFYDFNVATGGVPFSIPALDVDFEFRPIRKMWVDYTEDEWHARLFLLADEKQALTTDDPLGLSNHKDYWQQSPWLYQYMPIEFFSDGSLKQGYYSDALSFLARDSEGNRLVLLRGASLEGNWDKTYFAGTVAAPYTPWDERFFVADNVPGAFRLKHQATDDTMVGATYTFRTGLIDSSTADFNQAGGLDLKYDVNDHTALTAEVAGSHQEHDLLTNEVIKSSNEGYAYKAAVNSAFDHQDGDGHTELHLSYTQMDRHFDPALSRYANTRDDHFWGNHITFDEYSGDMEYFRIGDGIDRNRMVVRARWKEKLFKERFENLIDVRNVHRTSNTAYMETVVREEAAYVVSDRLKIKGLFRFQGFPETTRGVDPFLANFYIAGFEDPSALQLENLGVLQDKDANRFTYSGALQYQINRKWVGQGFYEYTNDIPDFPRGLLNNTFRGNNDRVDGLLLDHVTSFLFGQAALKAVPPYDYFNVFRERFIFTPQDDLKFIFHLAQNGYKFAGGIDDNVNHEGLSIQYELSQKMSFFFDYTHSRTVNLPEMINSNYTVTNVQGHHNFYGSFDYKINSSTVFRTEYGVFGMGTNTPLVSPYSVTTFSLPTVDTEHLFRVSLTGDF